MTRLETKRTEGERGLSLLEITKERYNIQNIVDNDPKPNGTKHYRVRWYAYGSEENGLGTNDTYHVLKY